MNNKRPSEAQLAQYDLGAEYFHKHTEPRNYEYIYAQDEYWQLGYNEALHQHLYELGCARKKTNLYQRLPYLKDNN